MKIISNIFLLISFLICSDAVAYEGVMLRQIENSSEFKKFYKKRWNELHSNKTKAPLEQCIHDQYERIDPNSAYGRPPKNQYVKARFDDYRNRSYQGPFIMTPLQGCIRHHYLSEYCSDHHDQSVICNGQVFTQTGQNPDTPGKAINTGKAQKDLIKDSAIDKAVKEAIEH